MKTGGKYQREEKDNENGKCTIQAEPITRSEKAKCCVQLKKKKKKRPQKDTSLVFIQTTSLLLASENKLHPDLKLHMHSIISKQRKTTKIKPQKMENPMQHKQKQ